MTNSESPFQSLLGHSSGPLVGNHLLQSPAQNTMAFLSLKTECNVKLIKLNQSRLHLIVFHWSGQHNIIYKVKLSTLNLKLNYLWFHGLFRKVQLQGRSVSSRLPLSQLLLKWHNSDVITIIHKYPWHIYFHLNPLFYSNFQVLKVHINFVDLGFQRKSLCLLTPIMRLFLLPWWEHRI